MERPTIKLISGIAPAAALGRGNQMLVAEADSVVLMVAGL